MAQWRKRSCTFDQDDLIGEGAYSKVYRSNKFTQGSIQTTAVKVYRKQRDSENIISHAKRQSHMLKKIQSQFVCHYLKTIESKQKLYVVQKLQAGITLDKIINQKGRVQPKQAAKIAKAVLKGLEYLHSKCIMHRDLKPANIIYDSKSDKAVLLDLGFANYFHKNDDKILTAIVGSPSYMSPEILMGKKYNSLSDVWSFGCIIYEMLSGEVPFVGRNQKQILKQIMTKSLCFKSSYCPTLQWIVCNCLKIDSNQRMSWQQLFAWMREGVLNCKGSKRNGRQTRRGDTARPKTDYSVNHLLQETESLQTNCKCIIF